ncbi:hypothetical protein [Frigoribacterium sp. RIT-PI-h]|uniref:hypothetical protein n=1 Tax=Frigoribacterium sp. RIT-PI-h TaxID=1690245 RepID=UPI0006B8F0B6|nr:hypothetical protein [Frigoribacterium sp. RIT-PI-h]KPG86516.1 hypothetical protein AEQ27_04170 [Frigoribacterium sp. RIT-PI-h]
MPTVTPAGLIFTVDGTVDVMGFSDDLKAAKTAAVPHVDVIVPVHKTEYVLRFRKADSLVWVEAVDRSPARQPIENYPYDSLYGYNLRNVTRLVAPKTGVLLIDGKEVPLRVDAPNPDEPDAELVNEWAELFETISGRAESKIGDAIYALNEYESQAALARTLAALKKAQTGSRKKSA